MNGEWLGTRKPADAENHRLNWTVPNESGTLRAVAYNGGKQIAACEIRAAGEPHQIRLKPNRTEIRANDKDISSVEVLVTDLNGVVAPDA